MSTKNIKKLTSAISIYQRYEDRQNSIEDLSRSDMHFRIKDGSDMVIEETGMHINNPFKFKVEDIAEWSTNQNENIQIILENYSTYYDQLKHRLDNEIQSTYKPYLNSDGYETVQSSTTADEFAKLKQRLHDLRITSDSFDALTEADHRRKNIFDYLYAENGKNLENIIVKTYLDDLTFTNQCTVLQSVKEEEPKKDGSYHNEYAHKQRLYSIGEIIELTNDPSINYRDKRNRPLVFPHSAGSRLTGEQLYLHWNGLQVFDIDLKFSKLYKDNPTLTAEQHRDTLFNKLKHYPWLLGVTMSSSRRALHVYTKVSKMHDITDNDDFNIRINRYWYRMNYIQKHAAIAYVLDKHCGILDIYTGYEYVDDNGRSRTTKIVDSAMAQPGQGIAINHDPGAKWSTGFIDMYPCLLYHVPPEKGIKLDQWLLKPELLNQYTSWFYDNAKNDEENDEVQFRHNDLNIIVDSEQSIDGIKQIDMEALSNGDRYSTRWRVCNTIMYSFGDTETAKELCHHILQSAKTGKVKEITSFMRSAIMNRKQADLSTIKTLKRLGVKIGLDEETTENISDDTLDKIAYSIENSEYGFYSSNPDVNIRLGDDEYLGMKMPQIISSLKPYKINVVESPPNTGKTEFMKSAAKTMTVCLVLPFTSVIESKIVNDDEINELFDLYYGDRSVADVKKGRSVVMTIDKFSMLPKSKYEIFDIIAIDECHLLFTSVYRLPVVSQTIENIRTFLLSDSVANQNVLSTVWSVQNLISILDIVQPVKTTSTKFILMTGTLTGEIDYFKYYGLLNYIKIHKKHPFEKNLVINISKTSSTRDILLIKAMAKVLQDGGKVIHPTNKGDAYVKQIVKAVEHNLKREIKFDYYKRSNSDESFMSNINANTTVEDIEILFCSDYLSVGIDIKDTTKFEVMFSNDFTAESIEQFNNRLRSTNITCQLFFDVVDATGMQKPNIINTSQIMYSHDEEMMKMITDEKNIAMLRKTMNEKQQYYAVLGQLFSKYFVEDFTGNIKYIRSAFEIEQFEKQYTIIAKSLLYIKSAMTSRYQYIAKVIKHKEYSDERIERYEILMKDAKDEHDLAKSESFIKLVNFLGKDEVYEVLHKSNVVFVKESDDIVENMSDLHFGFDATYLGGSYIITWHKGHKFSIDNAKRYIKKMRKLYSHKTSLNIVLANLRPSGLVKKTELSRYMDLMELIFDDKRNTLSSNTKDMLEKMYDFVNPDDDYTKLDLMEYTEMRLAMRDIVEQSFKEITDYDLQSKRRLDGIDSLANSFVDTLFKKKVGKSSVKIEFRKVYPFDSEMVKSTIFRDQIYRQILLDDYSEIDAMKTDHISEYHLAEPIGDLSEMM